MRSILTAATLDRDRIEQLMGAARRLAGTRSDAHRGAVIGLLFYEDSLRTRVGFAAAAARLGASAIDVAGPKQTPQMAVPESLEDAVRCIAPCCDALCLRHPHDDAIARAAPLASVPLLNCGNGSDEHPTQALIDLLAIDELRGGVDGARIALVGDLRHMRTAHSLLLALACFEGIGVRAIAPAGLEPPVRYVRRLLAHGGTLETTDALALEDVDIVYVAGLPRTPANGVTIADQDRLRIDADALARLAPQARVLCPLPRIDEIDAVVDTAPQAAYFSPAELGLAMRMALLESALSADDEPPSATAKQSRSAVTS